MQIYSGIDEAGLGPILGPFCAALTTFKAPTPLAQLLKDQQKQLFYVDDSKKVYQGKGGLKRLEESVLTFFYLFTGSVPTDLDSFIPSLKAKWYDTPLKLPLVSNVSKIEDNSNKLKDLFSQRGISILNIKRAAVSAHNFNRLIDNFDNKSVVCQKIMEPLVTEAFKDENSEIIIDKQGGRKFYKPYLTDLFPGSDIDIVMEEDSCSKYSIGSKLVTFRAKADSSSFPVALSSMFAKYMRELSMTSFNRYWYSKNSSVKPTAGYYTDGVRFLQDLEVNRLHPTDIDTIRRKK